jgi:hypothetical protein
MAVTDADRDAVVAALEAWTATTDEVYVRARALARQTDRSPKPVGAVLTALAGTEIRGVDLEPPHHLAISVWKENSQFPTYGVVDTHLDATTGGDGDTGSDTPADETTTGGETESDDDSPIVTDGGQVVPTCPGCGGRVTDVWDAETGACDSCGEPLTDPPPARDDATAITNLGKRADSPLPRQRTRRCADSACADHGRRPDSEQQHPRRRPVVTTAGSRPWPAVHAVVSQQ